MLTFEKVANKKITAGDHTVVLPEGDDPRIQQAIRYLLQHPRIKTCITFSTTAHGQHPLSLLAGCEVLPVDHLQSATLGFLHSTHHAQVPPQTLERWSHSPLYQTGYLLRQQQADCALAGVSHTTRDVIRAALKTVGLKDGIHTVSGAFAMIKADQQFVFADCGVVVDPTIEQTVDIAKSSVDTFQMLFPEQIPQVAFLSFSTKGSAECEQSIKTRTAWQLFQKNHPQIVSEGELQLDAALLTSVRQQKISNSPLVDAANVLIFPDLNSGNIAYKITQRLAGFEAFGPILQGLKRPYSDLSRGASWEDVVNSVFIGLLSVSSSLHS